MSKQSAYRKKLIEVAIPLEIINCESVREKYIPLGLPSNMHLWWARRPLAASRAVIFSMLIDDPSNNMSFKEANKARKEIFRFIEKLVQWENTNNKVIINQARDMINKSLDAETRILFDPFSGGAAIPIEAQRLGLEAYGSDLNPVATMIGKSLVELPYQIKDHQPIFPNTERHKISPKSSGLNGLISDLENYGRMIREIALKRLEKYYPTANNKEEIAAWLWCRTVKCQNPACQSYIPLLASSTINPKKNQEVYAIPEIDSERKRWEGFKLTKDKAKNVELKVGRGANFKCPVCNQLSNEKYIKAESLAGRMGEKLVCLVLNTRPRKYIVADESQEVMASSAKPKWKIEIPLPKDNCTLVSGRGYGFNIWSDLFTNRQLLLLTTYVDILKEIYPVIVRDSNNDTAYANSLFTYLAFSIERMTDKNSSFCTWDGKHATIRGVFARQAIPMVWDFAETNPFAKSAGDIEITIKSIVKVLENLDPVIKGSIFQRDSSADFPIQSKVIICTDPPYYDNIDYSTLSDFFYIWLRESLKNIYPDIFSTILTPKKEETTAFAYRFGGNKDAAKAHFQTNLEKTFKLMHKNSSDNIPIVVFYAFKQIETEDNEDRASTGWEAMIHSLLTAGFQITGTWPLRTEMQTRNNARETNALSSSIVIVCRKRLDDAPLSTRREFISTLKKELPYALKNLQDVGIAPVDMAQSAIGPGMAVFSRYSKVLEADGSPMDVKTALQIINQELDAHFSEQEADMDKETRFCIAWYEQFGWKDAAFGIAEGLMKAHNTAINALETAGIVTARAGKVRLLKRDELADDWDPTTDKKLTIWECVQYLIRALEDKGEEGAAEILRKIGGLSEPVKELAYRLYAICEKRGWAEDGLAFNSIIASWQSITDRAQFGAKISESTKRKLKDKEQRTLFDS